MMRKIIAFLILLLCVKQSYAQYPLKQFLGSDSTLVTVRGGMNARLVLWSFTDTIQANTQRISQYAGALIYTTGTDKVWYRNSTATGWIEFTSSGGSTVNVYNSDGSLTGERQLNGVGYNFRFNDIGEFGLGADSVSITVVNPKYKVSGLSQTADTTTYKPLAIDGDGYFTIMDRWPGGGSGSTPTLQEVLATQLNEAVITTSTDISPSISSTDFLLGEGNAWRNLYFKSYLLTSLQSNNAGKSSVINITPDSISVNPGLGVITNDSLATASNMTNKVVMVRDTLTKRWEQISKDSVGGSGGGITAIGTINSETKAANGAVISGSNLVMQTADATYPGLLTSSQYSFIDSVRNGLVADSSYLDLVLGSGIYDSVYAYIKPYGEASWDSSFQFLVVKAGEGYTFTNGLTESGGTVKLGGTQTEDTDIDGSNTYSFNFLNSNGFQVNGGGDLSASMGNVVIQASGASNSGLVIGTTYSARDSKIDFDVDTIFIKPGLGRLIIDTLISAVGTKALRYNPTTGLVTYADTTTGGSGGTPAGNYGNVQLNRNGAFATPASDSLDFDGGLVVKGSLTSSTLTSGRVPIVSTSGLITDNANLTFSGGSYPSLTIGAAGAVTNSLGLRDAAGTFGYVSSETGLSLYGSTTYNAQWFYPSTSLTAKPFLRLYYNGGPKSASFYKTVITVDTLVGGASDGGFHGEGTLGDSTSTATTNNGHMYRAIANMYGNGASVNTFYSTIKLGNTNSGATQGHGAAFQSDFTKTGANTVDILYHGAFLSDQILSGIVNKRYGIKYWDAHVNTGAQLGSQMVIKVDKLDAATSNFDFLSDSATTSKLAGNILIGDSTVSDAAVNNSIHFFNGTAPSANIGGAIIWAEGGELKGRDASGNVITLTDPAGGSGTVTSVATNTGTGITGGTITTTGTIAADTLLLATRAIVEHRIDSLAGTIGSGITGTGTANQMAFFDGASTIKSSNAFVVSDALYPTFQVGGTGTNEGTIYVKDPAGTTGGISGTNGFYAFGSSTYKQLDFYSHNGGSYLLQMKNNAGVLTADFQASVKVTIDSSLQVNKVIGQAGIGASLAGYLKTNTGNLASTTNINPGILVYSASNNPYGMDLGYNSTRYSTRIFAPTSQGISFGRLATGATLHSNFTESMYLDGSGRLGIGVAVPTAKLHLAAPTSTASTGQIKLESGTPPTTPETGSINFQNGLLLLDSSTSVRDTIATREWVEANIAVIEGTYTPTLYNTTNVAASSAFPCFYIRQGDYVHVWGEVEIDATTALTITELGMELPIATSITNSPELAGTAAHEDNTAVQVKGDPTNDRAKFRLIPQTNTANVYSFHFSYKYVAP